MASLIVAPCVHNVAIIAVTGALKEDQEHQGYVQYVRGENGHVVPVDV